MKQSHLIFLFLMFVVLTNAQQKKKGLDVTSNLEVRAVGMKAVGNNVLAKDFNSFYGIGAGGQLMSPIHFGVALDYNIMFSGVKYGHENIVGNLGSQKLSEIALSVVHRDELSVDFAIEESIGFSVLRLNSKLYPGKDAYSEGRGGLVVQLKGVYTLDNEGTQQFVFGVKANTYSSGVVNENAEIQKYYRKSFLIGLTAGYRYNF